MKIELEDVDSPAGCLLHLGELSLMFTTRLEARQFVDRLQGRAGALTFGDAPLDAVEQAARAQREPPA